MAVDTEELKVQRVKKYRQVHEIQGYIDEQDALDRLNAICLKRLPIY